MSKRNYNRYNLRDGRKIVYKGITKNSEQRLEQHKDSGKRFTNIQIVGSQVTKNSAERWEEESLRQYRYNHKGKNPKYNKTEK